MTSVIFERNKAAIVILALLILTILALVAFSLVTQVGGLEVAGDSLLRYCVGSGGVCTGGV